ncbi:MAG: YodL domain-containing protein [Clostridiales bacterium]|nr:YodL domain-containing protein [Clostridiales bacterium]
MAYRYIANKTYRKIESSLTDEISKRLEEENIKFSGKINSDNTTTLSFNRQDLKAVQQIIAQAKNKGRFFTDEEVQAAKAVSLVDYLGYRGENLKRVGNNEYTLPEHDSMRISGNKYYWNSRSKGGNAVDFCMNYYNMTFQEAVKNLLDYSGNVTRVQPQAEKQTAENSKAEDPAKLIPFPLSEKTGRVFKYLTENRGLSADMVNSLINEGKIAQDINGNAVFKVFDKNGELSGSEVSGTSQKRYKQTTGLEGNGFTVNPTGTYTPEKAIFFESAIDLLSYYELHKDETALLISMGGLKDKTVLKVMEDYSLSTESCFVAVDNDEAGTNFTNKMKNEYNINAYPITEDERFNLHENIKDWNDLLKAEKEDKTEHLTAYHTTDVDFDTFKPGYRGIIWTEKNLDFAKSRMMYMGSDRIFTCDVTMKNPRHITYNSGENWDIDSTIRKARNEGYDGVVIDFKLSDEVINNSMFQFVLTRNLEADARDILYSIVKANASDAFENETLKDFFDRVKANNYITHSYVAVFKPEQVKIINKTLINEQPEIDSVEQERETDLKNAFEKAFQNHETFYIKHTEENFENYRIVYDDKENHYNVIADRIYPIAKIRESNIVEENLAADIDVDSVIDIIKSYDSEISFDNLKTADQIQQEKQLAAQAEQTVINNFMKNYINSNDVFCPNLDLGYLYSITNEFFYYENSSHSADEKIKELAERYRNGEDISTELGKRLDCETHIKINTDEERYDAGLPNDKDLFADISVEKDEKGITFSFGDIKRFCTWEEYGKGQFEYLKGFFRSSIYSENFNDEMRRLAFNEYGEEDDPEPERTMPEEKLNRLLARLDGKEIVLNRVGDFDGMYSGGYYEIYGESAKTAAEILGLHITQKEVNGVKTPMVGFPYFVLDRNEKILTDSGYTVNIREDIEKINAVISAMEKYNTLYFMDKDFEDQYIFDARRSVFKNNRLVNDNGNYKLIADRISPSLASDVVLNNFISLRAAAEYAEKNNFEIDYKRSERKNAVQTPQEKLLPFAVGDSVFYTVGNTENLWTIAYIDLESNRVTLLREKESLFGSKKEIAKPYIDDFIDYFNVHNAEFIAIKTTLENHEPVYLIGNEEILHNPRIEYADGFRIASDDEYGGIHARRLVNMDVMSIIKYIKDEEYRVDYSRLGLTKTVDLEVEESEPEVSEKEAFAPEYIYKMEVNPKTTGRENLYFIQSYLTKQDGKADVGDILYVGTPEKCQELMEKLNAGELTQDEVKELYRKSVEQAQTNPDKDSFSVYQLKSGDETRYHRYISYEDLQKSGLSVDNSNYNLAYKAPIEPKTSLENIFLLLNIELPEDFKGHSLSVSDIIVLHKDGQDKAYYVDSVGFKEVPEFLHQQEISKEAKKNENTEKSSIHFGLLGNGITVYDISREKDNDYLTVAHISDKGVVKYYVDDLKETDKELIQREADKQKAAFTEKWNELNIEKKYDRILAAADTNQLVQITGDMISTEDRVKKYEHSIIFKDEDFPKDFKSSIIGNTPYRYIPKKQYKKINNDSDFTNSVVEKIGGLFESADIKYSGIIKKDFTTITFSKNDIEKVQPIIDSVINQKVEADKKAETEKSAHNIKKSEKTDVENNTEEATQTITQTDIDSVLSKGSGFQSGKYRIYRQFKKQEKSKVNADFLKKEYGSGNSSHAFSDGVIGWSSFDSKGLSIIKYSNYDNPDVKMSWSQVEKQIKKLISESRYFTNEDNTKYPEFLKSINAPQYEIDNFIKSVHQRFIESKSKLPPEEKRDSLALRLSDFIRYLDGYEQGLLKDVGRADLADISADEMEKHLGEPETVQQLLDFLKNVQRATSGVYSRNNARYFRQELSQLYPMQYVCKADDIVYINSEKYEVLETDNKNFILRNVEMALDTICLSFEELQKQLSGSEANNIYKRVITENSAQNIAQNQQIKIVSTPTAEQSQNKAANFNAKSILEQSFSQNIIDLFLQQGSNTDNARMVIATEFMKQKPIEEIAESLKTIYHGGFGIQVGNRTVSAWYDNDGIHLSAGKTARYNKNAQVISWVEAAKRIGQLLKDGTFESNVELVEADGYERDQLAEKVLYLYRDISDEGREQNLFSSLETALSGVSIGFPERKSFLKEKLSNPEFRKALSADFYVFKAAYKQNRDVLRFHYHKVDSIDRDLKELELPRISFESNMSAVPTVNAFITDDEINADLAVGSGFENGKNRIYKFFNEKHTLDEKAAFLKNEYGIGGHSHALSKSSNSWQAHNSNGIGYNKGNCEKVSLSWQQIAKRINELIANDRYLSKKTDVSNEKQNIQQEIATHTPLYKNTGKYAA